MSTISSITSRGVKCSPAVSFDASANFRMSSSKMWPISSFGTDAGDRSTPANFWVTWKRRSCSSSSAMRSDILYLSKMSFTLWEKPVT